MSNIVTLHDDRLDDAPPPARSGPGAVIALADDYWRLANRVAATEFVPTKLRNRPEAVLAALLSGAERGLGPMESLRSIHVIEGPPSLSAEADARPRARRRPRHRHRRIHRRQGAPSIGRRARLRPHHPPFTWTIDRARRARLANKDNWRKYPEAMLLARATAELCNAVFPDVIAGLAATEEISDELVQAEPATTRRRPPPPAWRGDRPRRRRRVSRRRRRPPHPPRRQQSRHVSPRPT